MSYVNILQCDFRDSNMQCDRCTCTVTDWEVDICEAQWTYDCFFISSGLLKAVVSQAAETCLTWYSTITLNQHNDEHVWTLTATFCVFNLYILRQLDIMMCSVVSTFWAILSLPIKEGLICLQQQTELSSSGMAWNVSQYGFYLIKRL